MLISSLITVAVTYAFSGAGSCAEEGYDPYHILNKYYECAGGLQAFNQIKTLHSTGTFRYIRDDYGGPFEYWSTNDGKERREIVFPDFTSVNGFNGAVSWNIVGGDFSIIPDEEWLQEARVDSLRANFEHLKRDSKIFNLSALDIEKVGIHWCYVIKVENTIIDDYSLAYIDTVSFNMVKTSNIGPKLQSVVVYSDFRRVDGIVFPFVGEYLLLPDSILSVERIHSIILNEPVDESIFDPPAKDGTVRDSVESLDH